MFATTSFATVCLVLLLLYVFRRNIRTVNEIAPTIVDHSLRSVAAAAEYAEDVTLVNIAEANIELAQRAAAVEAALEQTPAINLRDLYRRSRGIAA